MRSNELPERSTLFIDSNIFIYHFSGISDECSGLLERCEGGELKGVTSAHILAEVLYRLMMIEAVEKRVAGPGEVAKGLKTNPDGVRRLRNYYKYTMQIPLMGIEVLPLSIEVIRDSQEYRRSEGFLTNDSLSLALMEQNGIGIIATGDLDFNRIEKIEVWSPMDV